MKVKSLKEICLIFVGANFHAIGQGPFASMPAELKHKILQSVCLRRKNFTPAEFQFFIEPSDHLTSLDLSQCRSLNENHFELMATKCRQLVSLNVAGCVSVTYDVLQRITESCPHIRQLILSGCPKVLPYRPDFLHPLHTRPFPQSVHMTAAGHRLGRGAGGHHLPHQPDAAGAQRVL